MLPDFGEFFLTPSPTYQPRMGYLAAPSNRPKAPSSSPWHAAQRWQQFDGELRANMLRVFSLAIFFTIHLVNYYRPFGLFEIATKPELWFHQGVTTLVAAWVMVAFAIFLTLRQRVFPTLLPYATTAVDIAFITALLCMGGGQQSPLIAAFPMVLVMAALRFNLTLIRMATLGCLFSYLFVSAAAKWPELLGDRQIGRVPRYSQVITLACIGIAGVMLGQLIRRIQTIASWYACRVGQGGSDE